MFTYIKPARPLTWLITGCSSGLGLELTRKVQAHGDIVIATSRQPSRTPDLVEEVKNNGGEWHQLDVDDSSGPKSLMTTLESTGHHVDVLVNNAGVIAFGVMEQFTDKDLLGQMETLYFGPQRLIRAVLPGMRKRRSGFIVNISSGAALDGYGGMGAYAAAKAALDASTRILAKEIAPFNIRPLTVWIGTLNTNIGNASTVAKGPLPEDYRGGGAEQLMKAIQSGMLVANSDKKKAAKAIYEVVVGEGAGAGHENERSMALGRDMLTRLASVRDQYAHTLEVLGDVCGSVDLEHE
ncbi:Short-chain dehydrogenase/reductase SDR [Penicillium longicatenatum]|nr:Short-chain dehydrogenase/reductase SDR [Penicillium longicatenatum]